jgi:hypothetical protein
MGRCEKWPGLLVYGPRPVAGGEGCFEASTISWSCASPTKIIAGLSSTTKGRSSFNRAKVQMLGYPMIAVVCFCVFELVTTLRA